jgi:hypothetical protein
MAVILLKIPDFESAALAETTFTQKLYQIIEQAHKYIGENVTYDDQVKDLLQMIVLNLQSDGLFFYNTEDVVHSFSASTEVDGDGDGKNYTCYLGHEAASINRPPTGVDWAKYWYEGGQDGVTWIVAADYTATGNFYPVSNTLDIDYAYIRYQDRDYPPLRIFSAYKYSLINKKQQTGTPSFLFYDATIPPRCFLYPQIHRDKVGDYLLVYRRVVKLSDHTGISEMDDFTSTWLLPLARLLAVELALQRPTFPADRLLILESKATEALKRAKRERGMKVIHRAG